MAQFYYRHDGQRQRQELLNHTVVGVRVSPSATATGIFGPYLRRALASASRRADTFRDGSLDITATIPTAPSSLLIPYSIVGAVFIRITPFTGIVLRRGNSQL